MSEAEIEERSLTVVAEVRKVATKKMVTCDTKHRDKMLKLPTAARADRGAGGRVGGRRDRDEGRLRDILVFARPEQESGQQAPRIGTSQRAAHGSYKVAKLWQYTSLFY